MEIYQKVNIVLLLSVLTFILNLPFGYARIRTKRFSIRWFICIHLPIPFIFIIRTLSHIEIKFIPLFALSAIIGQILGGKIQI